jgi:hypothetical protein
MIALQNGTWLSLSISILAGVIVTVFVLLTRMLFYRIRDALPAGALFCGIRGVSDPCLIFIRRMTDPEQKGQFKTPKPLYQVISKDSLYCQQFDENWNIPWVTSTATAQAMSQILNTLGRVGRTDNIEITYHDTDYDRWDAPMFIVGGGWKCWRAYATCKPYFTLSKTGFGLSARNEVFKPRNAEEDMGLLQKTYNPSNGLPVWILDGYRGAGVIAASYSLVRWWKYLGWLYGKKPFGLLVSCNDRDGWQQSHILNLYPRPTWFVKLRHPFSWGHLRKVMIN